jgi:hypothetical protein
MGQSYLVGQKFNAVEKQQENCIAARSLASEARLYPL